MDRTYKAWTTQELSDAKDALSRGQSFAEIGLALYRTTKSVKAKLAPRYKDWTPQELAEARRMRAEGMFSAAIGDVLGRSQKSVESRLKRPDVSGPRKDRVTDYAERPLHVPLSAWEDRERRQLLEPRDLTAAFCGDPPLGYSALDRMREQGRTL